jgi:hypothetical protein
MITSYWNKASKADQKQAIGPFWVFSDQVQNPGQEHYLTHGSQEDLEDFQGSYAYSVSQPSLSSFLKIRLFSLCFLLLLITTKLSNFLY